MDDIVEGMLTYQYIPKLTTIIPVIYNVVIVGPRLVTSYVRSRLPSLFVRQMTEMNLIIPEINITLLGCIGQGIYIREDSVHVYKPACERGSSLASISRLSPSKVTLQFVRLEGESLEIEARSSLVSGP